MTSSKPFSSVPAGANQEPTPFELHTDEQKLQEFKILLKLSPVAKQTYENLQEDGEFGVTQKWMVDAKKHWQDSFDWYVNDSILMYRFNASKEERRRAYQCSAEL